MTPKEKAQELFEKFNYHVEKKDFFGDDVEQRNTKQCALIAVDEIISNNNKIPGLLTQDTMHNTWFWQEVKREIEEL